MLLFSLSIQNPGCHALPRAAGLGATLLFLIKCSWKWAKYGRRHAQRGLARLTGRHEQILDVQTRNRSLPIVVYLASKVGFKLTPNCEACVALLAQSQRNHNHNHNCLALRNSSCTAVGRPRATQCFRAAGKRPQRPLPARHRSAVRAFKNNKEDGQPVYVPMPPSNPLAAWLEDAPRVRIRSLSDRQQSQLAELAVLNEKLARRSGLAARQRLEFSAQPEALLGAGVQDYN